MNTVKIFKNKHKFYTQYDCFSNPLNLPMISEGININIPLAPVILFNITDDNCLCYKYNEQQNLYHVYIEKQVFKHNEIQKEIVIEAKANSLEQAFLNLEKEFAKKDICDKLQMLTKDLSKLESLAFVTASNNIAISKVRRENNGEIKFIKEVFFEELINFYPSLIEILKPNKTMWIKYIKPTNSYQLMVSVLKENKKGFLKVMELYKKENQTIYNLLQDLETSPKFKNQELTNSMKRKIEKKKVGKR